MLKNLESVVRIKVVAASMLEKCFFEFAIAHVKDQKHIE